MALDSGKLRHRVRIEQFDLVRDASGEAVQDPSTGALTQEWVEVATVWASIEPLSAREFIQSAATQAQITARIVIRYRSGLDASMRLVHVRSGRPDVVYNIAGLLPDLDSGLEYITIPVSSGTGEGQ